jgi:hypothetical protein
MEIHFHGPLLARGRTRSGPSGDQQNEQEETPGQEQETDDAGRPTALPALLALVVLVALAYAVRRLRDGTRQATLDEPTD